jgi:bifunctional non-homologous end joining protein LigD
MPKFIVHKHKTGRTHFDLRIVLDGVLRSWSLLKEPPWKVGARRLAVERESFPIKTMNDRIFEEEAFGGGRVDSWDEGEVEIDALSPLQLILRFKGSKISGKYELRRMRWYPGNRWLLTKQL